MENKVLNLVKIECELPHYRKGKNKIYMIRPDHQVVSVVHSGLQVKIGGGTIDEVFDGTIECSREVFMEEHRKSKEYLNDNEMFFN